MKLIIQDKSNYLKGLLILAKKDNVLSDSEGKMIRNIAQKLGFSSDFYEDILNNLLSNEYLSEDPVTFSNQDISRSFIMDGLKLARSDMNLDTREIEWLRQTAEANTLSSEWFEKSLAEIQNQSEEFQNSEFALYSHL